VYECPNEPRKETTYSHIVAFKKCVVLSNDGEIAFVKVTEGPCHLSAFLSLTLTPFRFFSKLGLASVSITAVKAPAGSAAVALSDRLIHRRMPTYFERH
jgi:hypothetical protein